MPASERLDTYGVFYDHSQLDGQHFADTKEKRYNDVVMCEVFIKGSSTVSKSKLAIDKDGKPVEIDYEGTTFMDLYPKAWAAYNKEKGTELDGIPLRNVAGIGVAMIRNLNSMGVETAEDLAELSDSVVLGESGMLDLRNRARAYLAAYYPEKAEAEKKEKEAEMENLRLEVQQMKEALSKATIPEKDTEFSDSKPPRKRGRPKKEAA